MPSAVAAQKVHANESAGLPLLENLQNQVVPACAADDAKLYPRQDPPVQTGPRSLRFRKICGAVRVFTAVPRSPDPDPSADAGLYRALSRFIFGRSRERLLQDVGAGRVDHLIAPDVVLHGDAGVGVAE